MKAVRLFEIDQRPRLVDVQEPTISGPLDVIVRIAGAGVCRTDLHLVEGVFEDSCRCSRIHVKAVRDSMSITTHRSKYTSSKGVFMIATPFHIVINSLLNMCYRLQSNPLRLAQTSVSYAPDALQLASHIQSHCTFLVM